MARVWQIEIVLWNYRCSNNLVIRLQKKNWPHCDSKMAARSTVQWGILNMKHSHNGDTIFLELHLNAFTPTIARHFHLDWEYLVKWQKYKKNDNSTSEWSWPHCDSTMAARSTVQWGILVIYAPKYVINNRCPNVLTTHAWISFKYLNQYWVP